jgi:hypothetical protein
MPPLLALGLSAVFSLAGSIWIAARFAWPALVKQPRDVALEILLTPHLFRFIGLSFLVTGVVSADLPRSFALPAAYGDLGALALAWLALLGMRRRWRSSIAWVWAMNIWGLADFVFAFLRGIWHLNPGQLGAAFYIPTFAVPPLFVAHFLAFGVLLRHARAGATRFEVERVDVPVSKSFAEAVSLLEHTVPEADVGTFNRLVATHATQREIESAIQPMAGELGLMNLAHLEQGPLVSLLGRPKKMTTFLIGNPVLANRMFERDPAIAAYAPVRFSIYEDSRATVHVLYDRPSTLLRQFHDEEVDAVASALDEKLSALAAKIASA